MIALDELTARAHFLSLPLRVPFRGVDRREVCLFDASTRWSEWSPFLEYGPEEAARWLAHAVDYGFGAVKATPERDKVEVNATIPAVDVRSHGLEIIDQLMQRYPGCSTVKVKVAEKGQQLADDVARVDAVRRWFAEHGHDGHGHEYPTIRVDANGGWSVEQAREAARALTEQGPLDYMEQPCASITELAQLRQQLARGQAPVRIAADEAIRKSANPKAAVRAVVEAAACDVAVLKVPPLSGIDTLLDIAHDVSEEGVAITVSSALDSAVGIGAGIYAAACVPQLCDGTGNPVRVQPAGLATGGLFAADVARRDIVAGHMHVEDVVPDPSVLEDCALTGERKDWWIRRLADAYAYLSV
ncbi:o-succinylbenzoate synthase [Corynebacterium anserum]|uniref:O-succinylbenzoate synthase n=1 Tax=Corynebacterium anserum TaxID=2684406 RepID=A0A7G7YQ53_9CORY|nr:o-succinylbenzoate synthase [Corynebacterium anserum]MBC2682284.1 o-succinylbenzoate synthase [Corynebacterium anserum]QNH96623.1 o-succinylbenzoate synthase [Corynebacterium anserum]